MQDKNNKAKEPTTPLDDTRKDSKASSKEEGFARSKAKRSKSTARSYAKYSGMAMQMGVIILAGVYLGKYLDSYFQTTPYLLVAMSLFSIFAALYTTLKDIL